jgi:hypothetical protein
MMVILILAAGNAARFGGKTKHLLTVAGEPLLARTVRQLRALGHEPVIVSHRPELQALGRHFEPARRGWLCETLLSTRELWAGCTIVLLGDVVWPDEVLADVISDESSPRFFGNYCEIYAASWQQKEERRILEAIERVLKGAREWRNPGKMWQLYHAVIGAKELNGRAWDYSVFRVIPSAGTPSGAYTQDFDTARAAQRFLERNGWARDADNWPFYSGGLRVVVTGTGRCGTGFTSMLLSSAGLPCGHEAIFTPMGLKGMGKKYEIRADLMADSSWLAAPFLDHELAKDALIVHLVRHPRDTIDSMLRIGTMAADTAYTDFHWQHIPEAREMSRRDQLAYKYVKWNEVIERGIGGHDYIRFQIEREPGELLALLAERGIVNLEDVSGEAIFDNRTFNTRGEPGSQNVQLDDFSPGIREEMLAVAERYGYAWGLDGEGKADKEKIHHEAEPIFETSEKEAPRLFPEFESNEKPLLFEQNKTANQAYRQGRHHYPRQSGQQQGAVDRAIGGPACLGNRLCRPGLTGRRRRMDGQPTGWARQGHPSPK